VGLEVLLLTILTVGFVSAVSLAGGSVVGTLEAALGVWGIAYTAYLWVSFFLIASLRLPGCEFAAIVHVATLKEIHWCVDAVLNAVLDKMQADEGLAIGLMKTESARKWVTGLAALTIFLAVLASNIAAPGIGAAALGVFAAGYLAYDLTIHRLSIGRTWLKGSGDYPKLILILLGAKRA
jgi:hypothetical protein